MPITREEALLNTMATGVASGVEPITREEQYLSYIAGETYTKPDAPITRKEVFLDKIPQGGGGGGGVTIRNQNKTITANGTYRADSGYTGLGTVSVAVPEKVPTLQEKTATENGEVVADSGYDGLSKVIVNVASGGGSGTNKVVQVVDKTVTEITAEDLSGATRIGQYAFSYCKKLTSITIPSGVTVIYSSVFQDCSNLVSITIPSTVTDIGDSVFVRCTNLVSITIPPSVVRIGGAAFFTCSALSSVKVERTTPPSIQSSTFNMCNALAQIIVPTGCADAYKSATNWSQYADIIVEEGAV